MSKQEIIKIFGDRKIRSVWDDEAEIWYFSIVDVVAVLTESVNPANYWKVLKNRLKKEGNETVTNCNQLKLRATDGKMRMTDVATAEQMFRVIQSIPSPKAEPFKMWMAKVAAERIDQMQDPELSIQQALADYRRLGYTEKWIARRLKSIDIRKDLTDEWKARGVEDEREYAKLLALLVGGPEDATACAPYGARPVASGNLTTSSQVHLVAGASRAHQTRRLWRGRISWRCGDWEFGSFRPLDLQDSKSPSSESNRKHLFAYTA